MSGDNMEIDGDLGDNLADHNATGDGYSQLEEDPLGYNPQLKNTRYDPELRDDRRANKKKLKRRFEHIFEKYERDFEGIGDEIDIKTGEIVVDNGHLQRMQNEHDIGNKAQDPVDPSLDSTEPGLNKRTSVGHRITGHEIEDSANDDAVSDDEGSSFEEADNADSSAAEEDEDQDSATSPFDADESALEEETSLSAAAKTSIGPTAGRERSMSETSSASDSPFHSASSQVSRDDDILNQVPGLKDSMLNLQCKYKRGETVDPDAIQALGMSIANQLANFISRPDKDKSRRKSRRSKDATWTFPGLPADQARKRRPRSPSPATEYVEPPASGKKSIWAPIRHPRQQKRRRMKDREQSQPLEQDNNDSPYPPPPGDTPSLHFANRTQDGQLRVCANCHSSESDVWRKGPSGELCNTCGMYLYRYGLMRPIESATDPVAPDDSEGEIDQLERDWWLASEKVHSTEKKEIIKPVGVKNSHFVVEEDALIIQLKEIDLLSWERMATYFPGRSAYALQCRYSKKLHGRAPKARDILLEQGYRGTPDANGIMVFSYTREPFKEEEDELLLKLRDEDGFDFDTVAESLPGRSPEVLEIRYNELVKELLGSRAGMQESSAKQRRASREGSQTLTRNARYSMEEDAKIIKLREVDKLNWAKIAEQMEGRNSFSLQKRYIRELCGRHPNSIQPPRKAYNRTTPTLDATRLDGEISDSSVDLNSMVNVKYSAEEDATLLDLREAQGLTWEEIDPKMPGRSRSSLKNRYNHLRNRRPISAQMSLQNDEDSLLGASFSAANGSLDDEHPEPGVTLPIATDVDRGEGVNDEGLLNDCGRDSGTRGIEPQMNADHSQSKQSFTQTEDELILKSRELESLPWPDIALQLPGKSVSSISERYYHVLLPRKLNGNQDSIVNEPKAVAASPAAALSKGKSAPSQRWTTQEDNLLLMLREQGKTWEHIATKLPGRTSTAARVHHAAILHSNETPSSTKEYASNTTLATVDKPLLKQAVTNNRRLSDSNVDSIAEASSVIDRPRGRPLLPKPPAKNKDKPTQIASDHARIAESVPPQSSAPISQHTKAAHHTADHSGSIDQSGLLVNQTPRTHAHPYPPTPFTQTQFVRQSSEPTPMATAFYATPARFNPHGHPYFVHLPATYPLPQTTELPASKPAVAKPPIAKAATAKTKTVIRSTTSKQAKPGVRKKTQASRAKKQQPTAVISKTAEATEAISIDEDLPEEDLSPSDSDHESWHESENESDSEDNESDGTEVEPEMQRETMMVDPDSADDELVIDNSFNDGQSLAVWRSPETKAREKAEFAVPLPRPHSEPTSRDWEPSPTQSMSSSEEHNEATEDQQSHSEDDGKAIKQTSEFAQPKTYDIAYVNAHPNETFCHRGNGRYIKGLPPPLKPKKAKTFDITYVNEHPEETFRHRGNGRWIRGPPLPAKPDRPETFDTAYVNARPNETFHHRGHGRWARGLPTSDETGIAIRVPENQSESFAEIKDDLVRTSYVDAHPDETFHHRGKGWWARGLPQSNESGKFPIRGPQHNGKSATVSNDELFDIEYVKAHPEDEFLHRGRGRWARKVSLLDATQSSNVLKPDAGGSEDATDSSIQMHGERSQGELDPEDSMDLTMDASESSRIELSVTSRDSDGSHIGEDNVPTPNEKGEVGQAKRPRISNIELLLMALESSAPGPMFLPDIYKFIEDKFECFKHNTAYRNGLRASLSNSPQFTKASTAFKSGWVLTRSSATSKEDQAAGVVKQDVSTPPLHAGAQGSTKQVADASDSKRSKKVKELRVQSTDTFNSDSKEDLLSQTDEYLANQQLVDDIESAQVDSSELSIRARSALGSSPPHLAKRLSPSKPVDHAVTPGTGSSTLFSHIQQDRSGGKSTPVKASRPLNRRISSLADLGDRKRIVHTPVREIDDSEDELA